LRGLAGIRIKFVELWAIEIGELGGEGGEDESICVVKRWVGQKAGHLTYRINYPLSPILQVLSKAFELVERYIEEQRLHHYHNLQSRHPRLETWGTLDYTSVDSFYCLCCRQFNPPGLLFKSHGHTPSRDILILVINMLNSKRGVAGSLLLE